MPPFDMNSTYGAMLIGTFFAILFQGILTVQAYLYYESFPGDHWHLKSLVAVLWCLDLTHLVLICQTVYHYLIDNWGNDLALLESTIELDLHLVLVGAATILCQGFFLHRVWKFSKGNWLLVGVLALMCLTTVGLDVDMSIALSKNKSITTINSGEGEVIAMFSIGAAVDLFIAILLCWYLQQGRSPFERTNFMLARVIQYTVATGLATSLLAIGCIAAYLIKPNSFIFIGMHFSLGRMYTNALLATLNSRRNLRGILASTGTSWVASGPQTRSAPPFVVSQTQVTQDIALTEINAKPNANLVKGESTW
ncbi:hypothetical protein FB451DRAFT_695080 [Mycena latifolia]|nr:hypothetical protein FB451DRAFT_695080 [Mycena latifolia]